VVIGPTTPNPGPTFPKVATTALMASNGSKPVAVSSKVAKANILRKRKKKTATVFKTTGSTELFAKRTLMTAFGWIALLNSAQPSLNSRIIRETFIPPAVDPALPPINIRHNRINLLTEGH